MTYPLNFRRIFATILMRLTSCDEKRAALSSEFSMMLRLILIAAGN